MSISLTDLESAAFWDKRVCLDCSAIIEEPADTCPECESDAVYLAEFLLRCRDFLETLEESPE